ncbi:hypothetical protein [Escherichia coli]
MSHAVFPGVVLAWIVGLPLGTGAFVAEYQNSKAGNHAI